jgi:hypothetical protein
MGAIGRLGPDGLDELGLITRLQEVAEIIEADLNHLARPDWPSNGGMDTCSNWESRGEG